MGFLGWMGVIGALLMMMSLVTGWIRPLPITHFALYFGVGVLAGPWGLHLLDTDFIRDAPWMERLTEVALVVSLFVGGLKLRVPFRARSWQVARRLALPGMVLTIAGMMLFARLALPLTWAEALILAAALAPTDPVLASVISVGNAADRDGLRVALSGEAGLNDGAAMPFLLLGIAAMQNGWSWHLLGQWSAVHLVWGIVGGLLLGFAMGWLTGLVTTRMKVHARDPGPGALLTLGLIALSYSAAQGIGALGFLAAFAAGVGMRWVEVRVVERHPHPRLRRDEPGEPELMPAEFVTGSPDIAHDDAGKPIHAVGRVMADALTFGDTIEALLAPLLVLLLGIALAWQWDPRGLYVAGVLFLVVRPLAVWLATIGSGIPWQRRLLVGWLGIRGIGGLNYLAFALTHGLHGLPARDLTDVIVTVIALSMVVHGFTSQPLLAWRQRELDRLAAESARG